MPATFILIFFVSNAQKVGIGTDSPKSKLQVYAESSFSDELFQVAKTSDTVFTITNSGNIGIGVNNPLQKLHLKGVDLNIMLENTSVNGRTYLINSTNNGNFRVVNNQSLSIPLDIAPNDNVTLNGNLRVLGSDLSPNAIVKVLNGSLFSANLTASEIPDLDASKITTGTLSITRGGTGADNAATARTNLGATTVGSNLYTLPNPSAVRFLRVNADNSVSALTAADFRIAIGAGTGNGTVTSVTAGTGLSGGTITTTGTIALTNTGVTAGTYRSVTVDAQGRVSAGTNPTTLSAYGITDAVPSNRTITINGTTNRVTVTGGEQDLSGNRIWTITGPQDIHTAAVPTFSSGVYSSTNTVTTTISPNVRFVNTTTGSGANDGLIVGVDGSGKAWLANKENTAIGISTNDLERVVIGADGSFRVATLPSGFVRTNASGVFSSSALTAAEIPNLDASKITSGTLPIALGGTGSANAAGARTNLGLGTIATQNSNAVSITGGNMSGVQQTLRGNFRSIVDVNTTLNATDYFVYIGGGGSYTVTFPDPSVSGAGATLFFRTQYGAGTKTFASNSGSQIRWLGNPTPGAAWSLPTPCHCGLTFISDGAAWNLITYQ